VVMVNVNLSKYFPLRCECSSSAKFGPHAGDKNFSIGMNKE